MICSFISICLYLEKKRKDAFTKWLQISTTEKKNQFFLVPRLSIFEFNERKKLFIFSSCDVYVCVNANGVNANGVDELRKKKEIFCLLSFFFLFGRIY